MSAKCARAATNVIPQWSNSRKTARSDSIGYRVAKFSRLHGIGIVATTLVFLSLVTDIIVSTHQARIARAQRERAERRFNDVRSLANSLLFDLHDAIRDLPGSTPARKLIVEKSLKYLDSLSAESGNDLGLMRELATAYERVGELQGYYLANNLGQTADSLVSYRKALSIRRTLAARADAEWQDRLSLAEVSRLMASQCVTVGDSKSAVADIRSAVAISESLLKERPHHAHVLHELAFDYEVLGQIQSITFFASLRDLPAALDSYKKAVVLNKELLSIDPNDISTQRRLANDLLQIGNTQNDLGRPAEALRTLRQSLEMFVSISQRSPTVKDRRSVAVLYNQIAGVYGDGNLKLSLENHQKDLGIYRQLIAQDPKNALLQRGFAIAYVNTGDDEVQLGHTKEGFADLNRGLAVMGRVSLRPKSTNTSVFVSVDLSIVHVACFSLNAQYIAHPVYAFHWPFMSCRSLLCLHPSIRTHQWRVPRSFLGDVRFPVH